MTQPIPPLTIGQAAQQLGVPPWTVRRTVDALAPNAPRIGDDRVVPPEMMTRLRDLFERKAESSDD